MLAALRGSAQAERRAQATLASFLAARGEKSQAEGLVRPALAEGYMDHHVAYSLGVAHTQLGQREEALRWLRRAAEIGFPCHPWFTVDPLLQPLRNDTEFIALLEELRAREEIARRRYGGDAHGH